MRAKPSEPAFLERSTYRKRRMADGARLLPILGVILLAVPMLWGTADSGPVTTTSVMGFVFGVWVLLVTFGALLSRYPTSEPDRDADEAERND